jgi:hypothetical protein
VGTVAVLLHVFRTACRSERGREGLRNNGGLQMQEKVMIKMRDTSFGGWAGA